MPSDSKISLRALTSACVHLAAGAGALIRSVAGPGRPPDCLELVSKADDTPQTIADRHAQRHIISGLRAQSAFASVHIVGEEGDEEASANWAGAPDADLGMLGAAWPEGSDVLVCADDVSVWIDPLDGTKEVREPV
jgi:3'-phosphoadenosine 5'-phosphosulfate (PAPS) 3'-phosphatase